MSELEEKLTEIILELIKELKNRPEHPYYWYPYYPPYTYTITCDSTALTAVASNTKDVIYGTANAEPL